jgi:hypothetical protein
VHPTTVGYGLVANKIFRIMAKARVKASTVLNEVAKVLNDLDLDRLKRMGTLISSPLKDLRGDLSVTAQINTFIDAGTQLFGVHPE